MGKRFNIGDHVEVLRQIERITWPDNVFETYAEIGDGGEIVGFFKESTGKSRREKMKLYVQVKMDDGSGVKTFRASSLRIHEKIFVTAKDVSKPFKEFIVGRSAGAQHALNFFSLSNDNGEICR